MDMTHYSTLDLDIVNEHRFYRFLNFTVTVWSSIMNKMHTFIWVWNVPSLQMRDGLYFCFYVPYYIQWFLYAYQIM